MHPPPTLPPDFIAVIINIHDMIVQTVDEDIPEPGHFRETVGKIEAAVARIDEHVFGQISFPTLEEKAAVLIKELNDLHCFPDGNKRTSLVAMAHFLFWNHRPFVNTVTEAEMVRRIADPEAPDAPTFDEIVAWVRVNSEPIDIRSIAQSPRFKRYPRLTFDVRIERTAVEGKDRIAIRADARDPNTGRLLSKIPFLRRIVEFTRDARPEHEVGPDPGAALDAVGTAVHSPEKKTRRKARKASKNKRRRRSGRG